MKVFISLSLLFLLASGCGDGTGSKGTPQGDLETGECQGADCIDAGDGGLGWGAPPDDADPGEGDAPATPGGPADPCATHPNVRQCICARNPDAEECQEEERPLEIASRDDAMECTLDAPCEIKLKARGGSRSYAWSLRQSPEHLHTSLETRNDNEKATVTATPSLAGSSAFTAVLTDTASGESASKEITVRSTAAPVIVTYAGQDNGGYTAATDQDRIDLPVYRDLKLAVATHGAKLKRLRLRDIPCSKRIDVTGSDAVLADNSDESCPFIGITLWGHSMNDASVPFERFKDVDGPINARTGAGESYRSTAYLRAVPSVNGTFVVEAEDENGKIGTEEINVGYAPDPCFGLELKIDGTETSDTIVRLSLGKELEAEQTVNLEVTGGIGPFLFSEKKTRDNGSRYVHESLTLLRNCQKDGGRTCTARAGAKIGDRVRLSDLLKEANGSSVSPQGYEVTVIDTSRKCGNREAKAFVSVAHSLDDAIVFHEKEFLSSIRVGSNDTDGRSRLYASFKDKEGNRVARWRRSINLDHVGGGNEREMEMIDKSIVAIGSGGVPARHDVDSSDKNHINIAKFEKMFIRLDDPGSGGAMDVLINFIWIGAGDWCGWATITGKKGEKGYYKTSCEDESDRSDWRDCEKTFPIVWVTCQESGNKYVSPPR